ncbi:MAG: type I methionyl aminopeptidase [Sciscionella sp.]
MVEIKTRGELEAMHAAGCVVANTLRTVREHAREGVSPAELDDLAAQAIADAGGRSAFLHYHPPFAPHPYPATVCISVNDAIVHGIPGSDPLRDGDLVSVDCGVYLDGWCGDSAISFCVGRSTAADRALIEATAAALAAGVERLLVGNRLGDVSQAIGASVRATGYGLLADHGGHGVGRAMHEDPHVPNEGRAGRGMLLRPGLVVALEPMLIAGGPDGYRLGADGWTLYSADGSRAAHVEHTLAVTEEGPLLLTAA